MTKLIINYDGDGISRAKALAYAERSLAYLDSLDGDWSDGAISFYDHPTDEALQVVTSTTRISNGRSVMVFVEEVDA